MFTTTPFLVATILIQCSNAAVLLWSKNKIEISALDLFTDANLEDLAKQLDYPEVVIYKSKPDLVPEFEGILSGYYTAYSPNGDISTENATEISGKDDLSLLDTKQQIDLSKGNDILTVLVIPMERHKRDVLPSTTEATPTAPKGQVLYWGKSKKDNIYSLLLSSKPLELKIANQSIELGEGIIGTIDKQSKNTSSRLDVTVPVGEEKVVLQFSFTWQNTYWSVMTVKVKSTMFNSSINLVISDVFRVPAGFSYHCSGLTVYTDVDKTTELYIYDMQVQPDSKNGYFGDVYDCVDFTTVPIWSGLFVTAFLGVGLIVALVAISEIKTMDKFDNQKTKQLVITVAE